LEYMETYPAVFALAVAWPLIGCKPGHPPQPTRWTPCAVSEREAVMVDEPTATPFSRPGLACPVVSTVEIVKLLLLQLEELVKSCRVPSL